MPFMIAAAGAAALLAALWFGGPKGTTYFTKSICPTLYERMNSEILGQDWSLAFITAQICDHLETDAPNKPLVISIHGPPGVGKTMFHRYLARTLYNVPESRWADCPGEDCPAYKVLFSMSYVPEERQHQSAMLQRAVLDHVARYPESILVLEEYDKADADTRGVMRQLIDGGRAHNVSLVRSVFILESNAGFLDIAGSAHDIEASLRLGGDDKPHARTASSSIRRAGGGISPEDMMRRLKDIVYSRWREEECADRSDMCDSLLKTVNLIDAYVPFLPLKRASIRQLVIKNLERRRDKLIPSGRELVWSDPAVDFLTDLVEFDGNGYAVEGAMQVGPVVSRYVTRVMYSQWKESPADCKGKGAGMKALGGKATYQQQGSTAARQLQVDRRKLVVTDEGSDLELVPV